MDIKVGDKVKIVSVSDLDGDYPEDFPDGICRDPEHEIAEDWQEPSQSWIGQVGVVYEDAMNDYYDVGVHFEWMDEGIHPTRYEMACFKYHDVEVVK
jgi:hypothetical protein